MVSRNRGEVFFLDHLMLANSTLTKVVESDEEEAQGRRKQLGRKPSIDTVANKRYGGSLYRSNDNPEHCMDEKNISDRILDLNYIRSFLEFHNPFYKPSED